MNKILYLYDYKYIPTEISYWKNDEMLYSDEKVLQQKICKSLEEEKILWAGIGTYLTAQDGELYMCVLLEEMTKRVLSYSFGVYRSAELVGKALEGLFLNNEEQRITLKTSRNALYQTKWYDQMLSCYGIKGEMTPRGSRGQAAIVSNYFSWLMRRKGKLVFENWQDAINWLENDIRKYNGRLI